MKILLVDDNPDVRQLTKRLFGEIHAECLECANGREAVLAFQKEQPDWVLMDIEMPQMDGLTATSQIIGAFPRARVLILTQYDGAHLREAAREAGASGYFLKENILQVLELIEAETRRGLAEPK